MSENGDDGRIESLNSAVKKALNRMQTDGLAHQLELHKTSCHFVPRRMTEVLKDFIEVGREKDIQKLLHDIDNAVFERDKSQLKLQKARAQIEEKNREAKAVNKKLNQMKQKLTERISEIQQRQVHSDARYEKAIVAREDHIRKANVALAKSRTLLSALSADLSELRADVSLTSASSVRVLKSSFGQIMNEAKHRISIRSENVKQQMNKKKGEKEAELEEMRKKASGIRNAMQQIKSYINDMAQRCSLSVKVSDGQGFGDVLSEVIIAQQEAAVKRHMADGVASLDLTGGKDGIAQSARELYERIMKQKAADLDQIIAQARKRRLKLQAELDSAMEQLKSLQSSRMVDDVDLFNDVESSGYDLQATTQQLEATMSQLNKEFGTHRRNAP